MLNFLYNEFVFPVTGPMIFTRNFARGCVGELIAETIGLSGTFSLCILGRPYI